MGKGEWVGNECRKIERWGWGCVLKRTGHFVKQLPARVLVQLSQSSPVFLLIFLF